MTLSIDDLFTAQDSDTIRASLVSNLVSLGIPADKWKSGGVASTMLTVVAIALELMSRLIVALIKGFFLPTASGASLKLLAKYIYGVDVPEATFATGTVTLTNSGGGSYAIPAGGLTVQNSVTKATYTNESAFTLFPTSTLNVTVLAQTAGTGGNAAPTVINVMVTALLGVTCSNAASLVGIDAPTDETIRTLCLNKLGALSVRGVRTAYAYAIQVAKNSVTGAPVNINRWDVSSASHTGDITVVVASPSGAPDANDVAGVATSIEAIARPEAVTVSVSGATTVADTDIITVWAKVPDGVTSDETKTAIDSAIVTFVASYNIGGITANDDANPSAPFTGLFGAAIHGVIASAVSSLGGTLLSVQGAEDHALTSAQVITDSITTSVRLMSSTSGTTVV